MRSIVGALLLIPITIVFAIMAMLVCPFSRRTLPTWVMRTWAKTLLAMVGIRLRVEGLEHLKPDEPAIYMPNHATMIDILVLIAALPVDLRFIFKKSILFIPFVGQAIWLMGMIPIDRDKRTAAFESLQKAAKSAKKGSHILIFPEGTRTRTGRLASFKKGGFYMAIQCGIDILPITLNNVSNLCGRSSVLARSGEVHVLIHPRIVSKGWTLDKRAGLMEKVRQVINSGFPEQDARIA